MSTTLPMIQTTVNCIYSGGCLGTACTNPARLTAEAPEPVDCLALNLSGTCAHRIPITPTHDRTEQQHVQSRPDGTVRLTVNGKTETFTPDSVGYLAAVNTPGAEIWRKGVNHWVFANGEFKGKRPRNVK